MQRIFFIPALLLACGCSEKPDMKQESYPSGALKANITMKDSVMHGEATYYYENGLMLEKGNYLNGIKDGTWHVWYQDSSIWRIAQCNAVNRTIDSKVYYQTGELQMTDHFSNGKAEGEAFWYHKDSTIMDYKYYLAGNLKYLRRYDKEGNLYQTKGSPILELGDSTSSPLPRGQFINMQFRYLQPPRCTFEAVVTDWQGADSDTVLTGPSTPCVTREGNQVVCGTIHGDSISGNVTKAIYWTMTDTLTGETEMGRVLAIFVQEEN